MVLPSSLRMSSSACVSTISPMTSRYSPISWMPTTLHSTLNGHSATSGAPTTEPGTAVSPAAANLSVSRPDTMPQKSTGASIPTRGMFTVNSPLFSISSSVLRVLRTAIPTVAGVPETIPIHATVMSPRLPSCSAAISTAGIGKIQGLADRRLFIVKPFLERLTDPCCFDDYRTIASAPAGIVRSASTGGSMRRIALFSDIHGNLPALDAVLDSIAAAGVRELFCLGDLVGYGPDPEGVIDRIRARRILTVRGNYDEGIGMRRGECGCYYATEQAKRDGETSYAFTSRAVGDEDAAWLASLPM